MSIDIYIYIYILYGYIAEIDILGAIDLILDDVSL